LCEQLAQLRVGHRFLRFDTPGTVKLLQRLPPLMPARMQLEPALRQPVPVTSQEARILTVGICVCVWRLQQGRKRGLITPSSNARTLQGAQSLSKRDMLNNITRRMSMIS